jgi:hypothetical protein
LFILAFLIGAPLAWWAMNIGFRIMNTGFPFIGAYLAIACICSVAIALLTISFQAIKAAIAKSGEEFEE